jgi:8-oxo-dGTP pyrophosphatase MutT (NUDIX family)
MITRADTLRTIETFDASPQEQKSHELILGLLAETEAPFSRRQFQPGHITCSAVVFAPGRDRVLLMFHHRHRRWLLPGGHVEETDETLADTAARETTEETTVAIAGVIALVSMDVHVIPARKHKHEPFHLHHDLIFALQADSDQIAPTSEAPQVEWASPADLSKYGLQQSVAHALVRAAFTLV